MEVIWALGLMSGTSLDGVDAALLLTDGTEIKQHGPVYTEPYLPEERVLLSSVLGGQGDVAKAEELVTAKHIAVAQKVLAQAAAQGIQPKIVGFHGQTIQHQPHLRKTWQIGNGWKLAKALGIDVVYDFRSKDVAAGGQGAPLVPIYHKALIKNRPGPIAVLNIGGVANVTYIGADGEMIAFDTGPGNALLDDWCQKVLGVPMDRDGKLANKGKIDAQIVVRLGTMPFFAKTPPKSLDRNDFSTRMFEKLSPEDGAATLTVLTAMTIAKARDHFPAPVKEWIVCGGGRHNPTLLAKIQVRVDDAPFINADKLGWRGDFIEAEAFAYLAVRTLYQLPISFPGTTGVAKPMAGGQLVRHDQPEPTKAPEVTAEVITNVPVGTLPSAPGPVHTGLPPQLDAMPVRTGGAATPFAPGVTGGAPGVRHPSVPVPGGGGQVPGVPGAAPRPPLPGARPPLPGMKPPLPPRG